MPSEGLHHAWSLALGASLLTGLGSVLATAISLRLPDRLLRRLLPLALSFATGTLLGAVFLDLLPEIAHVPGHGAFGVVLVGILGLHLLERTLLWRHTHEHACEAHHGTRAIALLGDGLHNFVDGLAIAAAFTSATPAGLAISLVIFAHEWPHKLGNFALLLESGLDRRRALLLNALASLASVFGTLAGLMALRLCAHLEPYALALSAASFLYITLADLLPAHRKPVSRRRFAAQVLLIGGGIALVGGMP